MTDEVNCDHHLRCAECFADWHALECERDELLALCKRALRVLDTAADVIEAETGGAGGCRKLADEIRALLASAT